jgi:hypothetical protein
MRTIFDESNKGHPKRQLFKLKPILTHTHTHTHTHIKRFKDYIILFERYTVGLNLDNYIPQLTGP